MSRKGFTLVELMVVILIVAILAAVAIPIMRGRIDAAKWSEGKAMMGTIVTALRAYCAGWDGPPDGSQPILTLTDLNGKFDQIGILDNDLDGTYFNFEDFSILSGSYDVENNVLTFMVEGTKGATSGIANPESYTLDDQGVWVASEGL